MTLDLALLACYLLGMAATFVVALRQLDATHPVQTVEDVVLAGALSLIAALLWPPLAVGGGAAWLALRWFRRTR